MCLYKNIQYILNSVKINQTKNSQLKLIEWNFQFGEVVENMAATMFKLIIPKSKPFLHYLRSN